MRLLLDENLPKRLKKDFPDFEVHTIHDKGWKGKGNGILLKLMIEQDFDGLITFDKNLQYQQNFNKYTIAVLVLNAENNSYDVLKKLVPNIISVIAKGLKPGPIEIKRR